MDPLGKQVAARVLGIDKVEIGDVVNETSIRLFGYVLIEAPVSRFHMINGYAHSLGDDGRNSAVGVSENQKRVWLLDQEYLLRLSQRVTENRTQTDRVNMHEVIGLSQTELVEEDFVEGVVPVLAGVY
jgi:hypothetical protein